MRRAGIVALLLATVALALPGCRNTRYTRDQVRDRWVQTYEEKLDLTREQAACIIDRFLGETGDAELKPLTDGKELSDVQVRRIGELAVTCGVGG